jgi:hypothetical protein
MKLAITAAMTSALALATAAPVVAQPYGQPYGQNQSYGTPYRPTDQYMQQQRDYQAQREQYDAQRQNYRDQREAYRAARAEYDRRMRDWEYRRAAYDARYGSGAYVRVYGPAPVWEESRWSYYLPPGSSGYAYAAPAPGYYNQPGYGAAPAAGYYGSNTAYATSTPCNNNSAVTAGVVGALAGGLLGNAAASHGGKTGGTVLGALVGGGIGAAVGHAHDVQKCDEHGAYYSYNDTLPYRVDNTVYRDDRYADYQRRGCRLAPAPVNDSDYRYVRVCPDADGRYRVTG